jgi:L-lactate dehydrogenase
MARPTSTRVAIIGAGHVGATFAYGLLRSGLATEIVLLDVDRARAEGEASDLTHAVPFEHPTRIVSGDWDSMAGSDVVVVAAGAGQRPGQSRLDLAARNAAVVRDIAPRVAATAPGAVLVMATNPVDVLTWVALEASGMPAGRVIGSGTLLDTARFRALLAEHFGVDPRSVHAAIIGEHGDSEVPVWSRANVAGTPLRELVGGDADAYPGPVLEEIFHRTRDAAYAIIERKGATSYAIASGLVRLVQAIVRDQSTVFTVSRRLDGEYGISDVCLSLPAVVGRGGAERVLPLPLDERETKALRRSAGVIRSIVDEVSRA